jgi:hypothetical protein
MSVVDLQNMCMWIMAVDVGRVSVEKELDRTMSGIE